MKTTIVDALIDHGYDVWLKMVMIYLPPTEWTLDKAAVFDHPAAVKKIVEKTGADE